MSSQSPKNTDQLILRRTLGCVSVILFVLGGLVAACVFIPAKNRGGDDLPWYVGLPMGLGLMALGTYRSKLTFDRATGVVESQKRIVGYCYKRSRQRLETFTRVEIGTRIKRSENNSRTVYVVSLHGDGSIELEERSTAKMARQTAVRVAKFLSLPLHDRSSGERQIFGAEQLGLSVRQRAEQSGQHESIPTAPEELLCDVDVSQTPSVNIRIPAAGWSWGRLISSLPTIGFGLFFIWLSHDAVLAKIDVVERIMAMGAFGLGLLLSFGSIASLIVTATRRWAIIASAKQISLQSSSWLGGSTRILDASVIEDVFVNDPPQPGFSHRKRSMPNTTSHGVAIRVHTKTINFAKHLPRSEQEFLSQFLRAILEGAFSTR